MRFGWNKMIIPVLAALTILTTGCQQTTKTVSTATPPDTTDILSTRAVSPTPTNPSTPGTAIATATTSGPFRMVIPVDEILSGTPKSLVSTADGNLWLITDREIGKFSGTDLTVYLKDITGDVAGIDMMGRVWVVNEDTTQISAWNGDAWTTYGLDEGWTPLTLDYFKFVQGGQGDLLGRIWFATSEDVRVFDKDHWTVYTTHEMGMGPSVYEDLEAQFKVTILRDGKVWVTECDWGGPGPFGGRGIRWLDEGIWQGASSPVASGCALAIVEDSIGQVWAGVDNDLWRYDPVSDSWRGFALPEPPIAEMHFGFFETLSVDSNDTVWSILDLCGGASCYVKSGLYQFQDETWTQAGEVAEYSGYWGPIFDGSGTPWINWSGGIYRVTGNSLELASPLNGRFGAVDKNGRVWLVAPYEGRDTLWVLDNESME